MTGLAKVYAELNALRDEGIVEAYAVGGGMAALFYAATTRTYDVDVFVLIPTSGFLVSLSKIYEWARDRNYEAHQEHIVIHCVPVQFLVASEGLQSEAIEHARALDYDGVPVRVIAPEYLAALYVIAGGSKRRGRARDLFEAGALDVDQLNKILDKYDLIQAWQDKGGGDVIGS